MNFVELFLAAVAFVTTVTNMLGIIVCAGIAVSCICRLDAARVSPGRLTLTQVMYLAFAVWAVGTLLDILSGFSVGWPGAAVGLGIMLHLHLTYKQWAGADPVGDAIHWEDGHAGPANG